MAKYICAVNCPGEDGGTITIPFVDRFVFDLQNTLGQIRNRHDYVISSTVILGNEVFERGTIPEISSIYVNKDCWFAAGRLTRISQIDVNVSKLNEQGRGTKSGIRMLISQCLSSSFPYTLYICHQSVTINILRL